MHTENVLSFIPCQYPKTYKIVTIAISNPLYCKNKLKITEMENKWSKNKEKPNEK